MFYDSDDIDSSHDPGYGCGCIVTGVSSHFGEVPALHKTIIVLAL